MWGSVMRSMVIIAIVQLLSTLMFATEMNTGQAAIKGEITQTTGLRWLISPNVEIVFLGSKGQTFKTSSDEDGRYAILLPADTYKIRLSWSGLCSERRAGFDLNPGDRLILDFMIVRCGVVDSESTVPAHVAVSEPLLVLPDTPIAQQISRFQQQIFQAQGNRPEVMISFGKFEKQPEHITYFPFQPNVKNRTSKPLELQPLPVIVTVQKLTIRALSVILDPKTMTFEARDHVTISDGRGTRPVSAITLSFPGGSPKIDEEK